MTRPASRSEILPSVMPAAISRLSASNLAAQSAEQLGLATAPLIAVFALGAGPGSTGLLAAAQTLPFLLASLPLGWLADRMPRLRLMSLAEGLRAVTLLALLLVCWTGTLSFGLLALMGFLGALGTVAYTVSTPGLLAALAPRPLLARANARLELARAIAFSLGPTLAGYLVAGTGFEGALTVAATLSLAALILLPCGPERLPATTPRMGDGPRPAPWQEIRQGVTFVFGNRWLRAILWTSAVFNLAWFLLIGVYVSYAARSMGMDAHTIGLTLGLAGLGMLIGAAGAPRLMQALPFGRVVVIGPLTAVLAAGCMAATLRWPTPWLAAVCFLLLGAGPMVWTVATNTLRQHVVPATMLSRAAAVFLTVNAGARPIGAALGAALGTLAGESACIVAALLGFVVQGAIIVRSQAATLDSLEQASATAASPPRSGA